LGSAAIVFGLSIPIALAQDQDRDRDRDRDWGWDHDQITRIVPGTEVTVRTDRTIDVNRSDNQVYTGIVDRDVRGENDRVAIPRGSRVELMVRVAPDNDLVLDLESVTVNGRRFALQTKPDRVESQPDNSLVGRIMRDIPGVQVRGTAVRVPRDSVLAFRIERPLEMRVARRDDRDRQ